MYYIPEVSPLLDRTTYAIKIAFILPLMLEELRERHHGTIHHTVTVRVFLNGGSAPVEVAAHFPDCRPNRNYSFFLNPLLEKVGVGPHDDGFFVIEGKSEATFPLPSVLKTIGHWVAYMNGNTYVVTPSNVKYASARLDYGTAAPLKIFDYFGSVETNETMDTRVALINPYVGRVETSFIMVGRNAKKDAVDMELAPFSATWIALETIARQKGIFPFEGTVRFLSSHRIIPFIFFWDRKLDTYYSMDHTMPWTYRKIVP